MRRAVTTAAGAAGLALGLVPAAHAAVALQSVATGLASPTYVTSPPGDPSRLYITEKGGAVRLANNDVLASSPVVTVPTDTEGEEGLLSIAFPPDHASSRLFYVFYTADAPGSPGSDLLVEERRLAPSGDVADVSYGARQVLRIDHRAFSNHNGGQIHFGPDGNLWIATGDGGSSNDPSGNAQNPSSLLGKLLRITPTPGGGYTIPDGNPFKGGGGAPEIWALGLRNPWRWSFDRTRGDLYIGDVGEGRAEEVSRATRESGLGCGGNYGWDRYEGLSPTSENAGAVQPPKYIPPLFEHLNSEGWRAIAGGYVVRDRSLPELEGRYVYGDFFVDAIHAADLSTGQRGTPLSGIDVDGLSSLGEDARGRVYVVSLSGGTVQRLVSTTAPQSPELVPMTRFAVNTCGPAPPQPQPQLAPPSPGPGPRTPAAADRRAPRFFFSGTPRRQRALRRGLLLIRATCDETCVLTATARLTAAGRRAALQAARAAPSARRRVTLRLRFGPSARTTARRALRRGRSVRITASVRAVDAEGNETRRSVRIIVRA